MKRVLLAVIIGCACFLAYGQASALMLAIEPASEIIAPGEAVSVDIVISGLGESGAPSLGAYGIEILFEPTVLSFDAVVFGPHLGNPDTNPDPFISDSFDTDAWVDESMSGSIFLDVFSFLFEEDLDALQPAAFILASLTFSGLNPGESWLTFGDVDLSDAAFPGSPMTADLVNAQITVAAAPVPEPATILLITTGLIGLGLSRRKTFKKTGCLK